MTPASGSYHIDASGSQFVYAGSITYNSQYHHQPTFNNTYDRSTGKSIDSSTHTTNYNNSNHYDKVNFGQAGPSNPQSPPVQAEPQATTTRNGTEPEAVEGSEEAASPSLPSPPSRTNLHELYGDYPLPQWLQKPVGGPGQFLQSGWQARGYGQDYHPQSRWGYPPTHAPITEYQQSGCPQNAQPTPAGASRPATNDQLPPQAAPIAPQSPPAEDGKDETAASA